jgi:hypothetical protein
MLIADMRLEGHVAPFTAATTAPCPGMAPALCNPHQAAQYFPLHAEYAVLFTRQFVLTKKLGVLCRNLCLFRKHLDPLAEGRVPYA